MAERPGMQASRIYSEETAESIAEERKLKKEGMLDGFFDDGGEDESSSNLLDALFGSQPQQEKTSSP